MRLVVVVNMDEMKQIDYCTTIVSTMDYDSKAIPQKRIFVLKVNQKLPSKNELYYSNAYYLKYGSTL